MNRSARRLATAFATASIAATAAFALAPAAHAANALGGSTLNAATSGRCAPISNNQVSGTLLGADGNAINATIGMDLEDSHGNQIDARTGCRASGYGALLQLNHYIGAQGAPLGTEQESAPGRFSPAADEGPVDPSFHVFNLPANVTKVFVETYTRKYTGSPCGLPCAGVVDTSKYGFVNRQQLKPGAATANLKLVADETPAYGGVDGTIQVYIHSLSVHSVHAWSMNVSGKMNDEGWGVGVQSKSNPHIWTISALSPNQQYTMIASGFPQQYHIKVTKRHTTKVTEKF